MKKWLLIAVMALVFAGCGTGETDTQNSETSFDAVNHSAKGYLFEYNGVTIGADMEADPIISALGEPDQYFESASCAFEGLDKTYSYGSFEITTYEADGVDYINAIWFNDDLVETKEGVCLFEGMDKMTSTYGENYTKDETGRYTYEKDGMKLKFTVNSEDEIISIGYCSTVLDVE